MTEKVTIRTMIRNLMAFNLDAEFYLEKITCKSVSLFPDCKGYER